MRTAPAGVDPITGEITDDYTPQRLPFAAFLTTTDQGRPHADATKLLAEIVAEIRAGVTDGTPVLLGTPGSL